MKQKFKEQCCSCHGAASCIIHCRYFWGFSFGMSYFWCDCVAENTALLLSGVFYSSPSLDQHCMKSFKSSVAVVVVWKFAEPCLDSFLTCFSCSYVFILKLFKVLSERHHKLDYHLQKVVKLVHSCVDVLRNNSLCSIDES